MQENVFYAYHALAKQPNWAVGVRYAVILGGAIIIALSLINRLRHRNISRYRDLLVIVVLVVLLTIGIQVRDIQANNSATRNTQAVLVLMKSIARAQKVSVDDVYTNSTTVMTGMLVQVKRDNHQTYMVTVNANNQSFQLTKTNLIQAKTTYVEE